jgi:3-hydroxyisobutyrate dehydrogenase/2-hydroxy-3-oxopropionate reductase
MDLAVIGLGAMGSRIARRWLDAGHRVHVWNRTPARAEPLAAAGATVAPTPAEAAAASELVATVLADPAALREVTTSPGGLREGLRPGATVVEMSTVGPAAVHELRSLLPAEVELVDAPVLGSTSETEAGTLRVFVGATPGAFAAVRPVLEALGAPMHLGPLGTGAAAKLVANAALLGTLTLLGEVLALGQRLGVELDDAFEVLSATPLAAQAERRRPTVTEGVEPPLRFRLALAVKDADLVVGEARASGVEPRLASAAAAWFRDAARVGPDDVDYSAVVRRILEHPGGR